MSTTIKEDILDQSRSHLREWYQEQMPAAYVYHNFFFAEETVEAVQKVADKSEHEISDSDFELLSLAAWFQFTGMARKERDYYDESASIASDFLKERGFGQSGIKTVQSLIRSIRPDHEPANVMEKVYHDGIHLIAGRKSFFKKADLLRLEEEHLREEPYTEKEWSEHVIELLTNTHFYTAYARGKYGKRRLEHLSKQKQNNVKAERNTIKKLTGKDMGRGIDTLYRTGFRNHINLSRIADGKANMMISINTIVLSILLAVSGAGLSFIENFFYDSPGFALPVIILLLSSLTALVFAVFSAKPSVTTYKLNSNFDPNSTETNMLYFGNFLQLEKEDFVHYMDNLKVDQEQLYNDLSRDLYNLGLVLRKKYQLLTISYNVFVGGLVLSVLVFLAIYVLMA
ncbi:Pycsar system effector family protein [Flavilitoribacter nigricans]|uniref:Pycsar effector protein domain-containing protein n=1 Tax=Flavilitoribacter nigricans (strain ATCC 23147 / DSM 23189 / NBRC 102662 / NCIMB 1420 / SS-2) TaxID=1122177 RepID=A0A2D0NGN7_FLAN2|nr:Pycsar system effector family protein [Flavilitoribacter nigricans]PHN07655.1 hypothetical protein CRP01_06030 [Flavilitoribacter nigricans DSM 23189 = NBRC 102662]